ncbi:sulfatase-like hydrolase/transferase [Stieleria mannarensis]|uniref:sulfatase-like hydrolase/transferase n=1 Tax=Stieleria mannarensis TaxID=2755585 RepID=UPI002571244F|nr:sulfatase-like hydrolase/transferase [Rhodopirellula sp. JC639]
MANERTRFTQFYVTGVTCNPSRTGLITGLFPARFPKYAPSRMSSARPATPLPSRVSGNSVSSTNTRITPPIGIAFKRFSMTSWPSNPNTRRIP